MKGYQREVRFTTTRTGQRRAYYWSGLAGRWLPMPHADAELAVATGHAQDLTADHAAGNTL